MSSAEPRRHLGGAHQRRGGDGLDRRGAGELQEARQVRRHGAGHEPAGREHEGEQQHLPVGLPARRCLRAFGRPGERRGGLRQQAIERKPDDEIEHRPHQAGLAPAERIVERCGQRPAHRRGEAGEQRDAGDGAARLPAVERRQGGEAGIVEPERHPDAEDRPGPEQARRPVRGGEPGEPRSQHQVGQRQHVAPAAAIDGASRPTVRRTRRSGAPSRMPRAPASRATPRSAAIGSARIAGR